MIDPPARLTPAQGPPVPVTIRSGRTAESNPRKHPVVFVVMPEACAGENPGVRDYRRQQPQLF